MSTDNNKIGDVLDEVWSELESAMSKFPAMNSYHEGYAVLKEEVDELWNEVKKKQLVAATLELQVGESLYLNTANFQNSARIRAECVQIAAMAVRLILDCCQKEIEND